LQRFEFLKQPFALLFKVFSKADSRLTYFTQDALQSSLAGDQWIARFSVLIGVAVRPSIAMRGLLALHVVSRRVASFVPEVDVIA